MDEIRNLVVEGKGDEAAQLAVELGKEVGIEDLIWTNPQIPACQMEIEDLSGGKVTDYARSVNYETGEAVTAWKTEFGDFVRKVFAYRSDQVVVMHLSAKNTPVNIRLKLAQLTVVTEMILQSTRESLMLLPALPEEWKSGAVKGAGTRCGVTVDLVWEESQPVTANFEAYRKTSFIILFNEAEWEDNMEKGETLDLSFSL